MISQGKNAVDAAKENGLQHLIFSGMRSAKEIIGKAGCHHFESKKIIGDYIKEQGGYLFHNITIKFSIEYIHIVLKSPLSVRVCCDFACHVSELMHKLVILGS
jgi:NmrA-like family